MADDKNNKQSIFDKVVEAGHTYLDSQIFKAKSTIINSDIEEDFFYSKAMTEDPSYSVHSQGWKDKPHRLQNGHLKQMSYQDSAVAAILATRQNQVFKHSKLVKSKHEKGFMILLKDEEAELQKIKEEIEAEMEAEKASQATDDVDGAEDGDATDAQAADPSIDETADDNDTVTKGDGMDGGTPETAGTTDGEDPTGGDTTDDTGMDDVENSDDDVEQYNWELERKARARLDKKFEKQRKEVEQWVLNCGKLEGRTWESKKWKFGNSLKAWTRDSMTYDLHATEIVPDNAGRPSYWFPVDGGTIKYASRDLKKYKDMSANFYNIDILYPEKSEEAEGKKKAIELKQDLLDKDAYKWCQIVRGKVERAYTEDELAVGIRNLTTDLYNNAYGLSELELIVGLVTGHLNAEYYNQAYFTQGFSAKGILHIKAALNRRKVETVRTQWQHMLRGARNSFQTPIFAGVEDVHWIPLTQNHNDIGFEGWMRYLVTMMCSIYQIDPAEIGIHFKDEGAGGSLNGNSDPQAKIENSKDKGLYPLLNHFEGYINEHLIRPFNKQFVLKFCGVDGENPKQALDRQEKEVKIFKTVNEVRAENFLPPLPGCDAIILDAQYMAWYNAHSQDASEKSDDDHKKTVEQMHVAGQYGLGQDEDGEGDEGKEDIDPTKDIYGEGALHAATEKPKPFGKSFLKKAFGKKTKKPLRVEVYKLGK